MRVFDNVPIILEVDDVMRLLRRQEAMRPTVEELLEQVRPIMRPKGVYKDSYIDDRGDDWVIVDGIEFTSRVLRINLDKTHRIFPYVVTCGRELDEVEIPADDLMKAFCMDMIKQAALAAARVYVLDHMSREFALGQTSRMGPGSLEDWPLTQQKPLFSLLGDVESMIGVRLTGDCLMLPVKSSSGVCFPTEVKFESCQLCPRERCPGRRAPYDPALKDRYLTV